MNETDSIGISQNNVQILSILAFVFTLISIVISMFALFESTEYIEDNLVAPIITEDIEIDGNITIENDTSVNGYVNTTKTIRSGNSIRTFNNLYVNDTIRVNRYQWTESVIPKLQTVGLRLNMFAGDIEVGDITLTLLSKGSTINIGEKRVIKMKEFAAIHPIATGTASDYIHYHVNDTVVSLAQLPPGTYGINLKLTINGYTPLVEEQFRLNIFMCLVLLNDQLTPFDWTEPDINMVISTNKDAIYDAVDSNILRHPSNSPTDNLYFTSATVTIQPKQNNIVGLQLLFTSTSSNIIKRDITVDVQSLDFNIFKV